MAKKKNNNKSVTEEVVEQIVETEVVNTENETVNSIAEEVSEEKDKEIVVEENTTKQEDTKPHKTIVNEVNTNVNPYDSITFKPTSTKKTKIKNYQLKFDGYVWNGAMVD